MAITVTVKKKVVEEQKLKVESVPIDSVKLWKENPRKNDVAVKKLMPIIKAHGQRTPIVVWSINKVIYKGNTTYKAMKLLGFKTINVIFADFKSEAAAIAYGIADNKSSEFSEWDDDLLSSLMLSENIDATTTGFTATEYNDLISAKVSAEKIDDSFYLLGVISKLSVIDSDNYQADHFFSDGLGSIFCNFGRLHVKTKLKSSMKMKGVYSLRKYSTTCEPNASLVDKNGSVNFCTVSNKVLMELETDLFQKINTVSICISHSRNDEDLQSIIMLDGIALTTDKVSGIFTSCKIPEALIPIKDAEVLASVKWESINLMTDRTIHLKLIGIHCIYHLQSVTKKEKIVPITKFMKSHINLCDSSRAIPAEDIRDICNIMKNDMNDSFSEITFYNEYVYSKNWQMKLKSNFSKNQVCFNITKLIKLLDSFSTYSDAACMFTGKNLVVFSEEHGYYGVLATLNASIDLTRKITEISLSKINSKKKAEADEVSTKFTMDKQGTIFSVESKSISEETLRSILQ
jgi:hypothetical protein